MSQPDQEQKPLKQEITDFCQEHAGVIGAFLVPPIVDTLWHDPFVFLASAALGYMYPGNEQRRHQQRIDHIDTKPLYLPDEEQPKGSILASGPRPEMPSPVDRVVNWLERHAELTAWGTGLIIGKAFGEPGVGLVFGSLALQMYKIAPLGRAHSIEAQAEYHENLAAAELKKGEELPNLSVWHERRAIKEMERAAKVRKHKIEAYYPY